MKRIEAFRDMIRAASGIDIVQPVASQVIPAIVEIPLGQGVRPPFSLTVAYHIVHNNRDELYNTVMRILTELHRRSYRWFRLKGVRYEIPEGIQGLTAIIEVKIDDPLRDEPTNNPTPPNPTINDPVILPAQGGSHEKPEA